MVRHKTSFCGFRLSFATILTFILALITLLVKYNLAPAYPTHLSVPTALWGGSHESPSMTSSHAASAHVFHDPRSMTSSHAASAPCRDVLNNMLRGRWDQRHMTSQEVDKMRTFHQNVREGQFHMPKGAQRADKRCGNVAQSRGSNFKALCDPDGLTPCCYNDHMCRNSSVQECECTGCEDMRTPVHAEFATWRTADPACQPRGAAWSVEAICGLLRNSTLYFVGDSLMRHLFTAFLMAAQGNFQTGASTAGIPAELRSRCSDLYTFTEKECRPWIERNPTLCNGSAKVHLFILWTPGHSKKVQEVVLSLPNTTRSLALVGIGLHWGMNANQVVSGLLRPLVQRMKSQGLTRPHLVWAGVHRMGLLKSPLMSSQSNGAVRAFNVAVKRFLRAHHVPVFDTFELTRNVTSFDGTHYGYGVNSMKATIFLHYLQELRALGKW